MKNPIWEMGYPFGKMEYPRRKIINSEQEALKARQKEKTSELEAEYGQLGGEASEARK